jgi:hypothetical protein
MKQPKSDTPQSVPTCTCSKHPLWDGYDGDCPIHGWFEPVAPDTPQSVPADEQERVGFGYDAGVKCMRCGAKAGEPHLKFCPRLPDRLNEKYEAELDATPDAPLSQGRYAKSVTAGQAKMSEQIEALIVERDKLMWERDQAITNMGREFKDAQSAIGVLKAERDKLLAEVERHKEEKRQAHLAFMNSEATNAKLKEEIQRLNDTIEGLYEDMAGEDI